ncbi:PREDICTED: glutathione S-transferase 1-1-like [Dufourea novaeangliae]|uniref:glutathione S-transferase 1-1-like n=1 Tax=Dufourea novaeangliae TaxID=178035 RepID=UPI0007670654|nr:PREDICTED: glutathione S-transferase 1-1-like [Dufourea novaeangliae]XP_015431748.1 PREDICTED: glutathione S-transferase 1-1-like [Dufourea novaeangliae]XP_015431754.1 PREDICTED: glutathione S-transferase 1-1-like [Dufourea novaeangliae]XP_015431763.1 PREDICTED: glutathione S-transferase 1-1-like [Dufourea novaeangliae]XP_015431771.1 PREDICTED: glutathione S-transferase 1-1-like [Dufourea novaeangliae]
MSKVTLYSHDISPPCRSVLLVAHVIDLPLNIHEINLTNHDQTKDEFVKINPQRMIPAIDDNGFLLSDSHAIITYLVDKYANNDDIYPKDIKKRALVNQHLFFDASVFFATMKTALRPIFREGVKSVSEKTMNEVKNAYASLNTLLEGKKWLVGDSYTIADISCVVTATGGIALLNLDNYPNVKDWVQRCEAEIPGYQEINMPGLNKLQEILRSKLG